MTFALMMQREGDVEGFVGGLDRAVPGDHPAGHPDRRPA